MRNLLGMASPPVVAAVQLGRHHAALSATAVQRRRAARALLTAAAHAPRWVRMGWPVGRVLSPGPSRAPEGDHPSTSAVADALQRSTRVLGRAALDVRAPGAEGTGLLDLAPGGVCLAGPVARTAGGLLHHRFTLACPLPEEPAGGLFSVALSRGSPRVGVTHHLALWSPDLPRDVPVAQARRRGRPASPSARTRRRSPTRAPTDVCIRTSQPHVVRHTTSPVRARR